MRNIKTFKTILLSLSLMSCGTVTTQLESEDSASNATEFSSVADSTESADSGLELSSQAFPAGTQKIPISSGYSCIDMGSRDDSMICGANSIFGVSSYFIPVGNVRVSPLAMTSYCSKNKYACINAGDRYMEKVVALTMPGQQCNYNIGRHLSNNADRNKLLKTIITASGNIAIGAAGYQFGVLAKNTTDWAQASRVGAAVGIGYAFNEVAGDWARTATWTDTGASVIAKYVVIAYRMAGGVATSMGVSSTHSAYQHMLNSCTAVPHDFVVDRFYRGMEP